MPKKRSNPFVHRLIPTVAAASLTFACGPDSEKPDSNNGTATNNGATNNGATNNGAANNGATNNGAVNNGATNNGATNNGATNNGATNNGATNNGGTNNGTANNTPGTPLVTVNNDGSVAEDEIMAFCQSYADCDPETFGMYYDSVDACASEITQTLADGLEYYMTEYGPECAGVVDARTECLLAQLQCAGGELSADYAGYDACYAMFQDKYDMYCVSM